VKTNGNTVLDSGYTNRCPDNSGSEKLPALRGLSRLGDLRPTVIVDTREQTPLTFSRLPSRRGTLQSGDYSVAGLEHLFAIERKSIADLVGCCVGDGRERFERELHRLRGFRFARLLIIGTEQDITEHNYRSNVSPKVVLNTLKAFEARYLPVAWAADPAKAADMVETWAFWFAREVVSNANDLLRGSEQETTEQKETE
jgi:DNA excision repair protein ERCC-4